MSDFRPFPSDTKLRKAFPAVWDWYSLHHYPDPRRPVRSALMLAVVRRLTYLGALATIPWPGQLPEPADPSESFLMEAQVATKILAHAGQPAQEVKEICSEMSALLKWLRPPTVNKEVNAVLEPTLEILRSRVGENGDLLNLLSLVTREPQGRPSSRKRLLWVRAYEMKLQGKSQKKDLSYMKIAIKICDCAEEIHTQKCRAKIRQGIRKLERFLQAYGIKPPVHSPHDRPRGK